MVAAKLKSAAVFKLRNLKVLLLNIDRVGRYYNLFMRSMADAWHSKHNMWVPAFIAVYCSDFNA